MFHRGQSGCSARHHRSVPTQRASDRAPPAGWYLSTPDPLPRAPLPSVLSARGNRRSADLVPGALGGERGAAALVLQPPVLRRSRRPHTALQERAEGGADQSRITVLLERLHRLLLSGTLALDAGACLLPSGADFLPGSAKGDGRGRAD